MEALEPLETLAQFLDEQNHPYSRGNHKLTAKFADRYPVSFFEEHGWVWATYLFAFDKETPIGKIPEEFYRAVGQLYGGRVLLSEGETGPGLVGALHARQDVDLLELELEEFLVACMHIEPGLVRVAETGRWESEWNPLLFPGWEGGEA